MRAPLLAALLLLASPVIPASGASQIELVVTLEPGTGPTLAGVEVLESWPFIHSVRVRAPAHSAASLSALPGVSRVSEVEPLSLHLQSSRPALNAGKALWDLGYSGEGVTVAVVDSGIDEGHPAFQGKVKAAVRVTQQGLETARGDSDGHGTHIAGIVAGTGAGSRDGAQAGIAPAADLVAIDISSSFTTTTAIRAFEWIHENFVTHNIRVVSNSWGREKPDAHYDPDDALIRASDALVRDGIVVIFSAGNRGGNGGGSLTVEAMNPNVITVGASDDSGNAESYSSRGPAVDRNGNPAPWLKPDVIAPGTSITSARSQQAAQKDGDGYYVTMSGTSMAAPHVAGVVALMLDADPGLSPEAVKSILQETSEDRGEAGPDELHGYGFVDAGAALSSVLGGARETVSRVPVHASGSVSVVNGVIVARDGKAEIGGERSLAIPVTLPLAASGLDVAFSWSGDGVQFTVFLTNGAQRYGPFEGAGAIDIHVDGLAPGAWKLEAVTSGTGTVSFTMDGAAEIVEKALPAGVSLPKRIALQKKAGFFEEWKGTGMILGVIPMRELPLLLAAIALVSAGLAVWLWLRWRKPDRKPEYAGIWDGGDDW